MELNGVSKIQPVGDQPKAIAYIDGANLHKGVSLSKWILDYKRFRSWIRQKFGIQRAYVFIGLIEKNRPLYTFLQNVGFSLVFKEVIFDHAGKVKGNCDADLVLRAVRDSFESHIDRAILVASDGDYASLVRFWQEKNISCTIISPAPQKKCSVLLKRTNAPIVYLSEVEKKVSYIPK